MFTFETVGILEKQNAPTSALSTAEEFLLYNTLFSNISSLKKDEKLIIIDIVINVTIILFPVRRGGHQSKE